MANDLNRVVLMGRLTKDPELKTTAQGQQLTRFTLASNYAAKVGDQWQDKPGFFDCIIWGNKAHVLAKYAVKGQRLLVEGQLRWSSWEGTDGKKHSRIEIHVDGFNFIERKEPGSQQAEQGDPAAAAHFDAPDDDIPF